MDKEMMKKKLIDKIDTYWCINRFAVEEGYEAKAEITEERFLAFCEVLDLMGYDVNWVCCDKSGRYRILYLSVDGEVFIKDGLKVKEMIYSTD